MSLLCVLWVGWLMWFVLLHSLKRNSILSFLKEKMELDWLMVCRRFHWIHEWIQKPAWLVIGFPPGQPFKPIPLFSFINQLIIKRMKLISWRCLSFLSASCWIEGKESKGHEAEKESLIALEWSCSAVDGRWAAYNPPTNQFQQTPFINQRFPWIPIIWFIHLICFHWCWGWPAMN